MTTVVPTPFPAPVHIASAPVSKAERSLAPDLARGFMLLFIVIANLPVYLYAQSLDAYGLLAGMSDVDRWVRATEALLVVDRSRPMFAILYGFGMAMMAARLIERTDAAGAPRAYGVSRVRGLLAKRSALLVALGALHAVFLFMGDILLAYGITGLLALFFVTMSTKVVAWVAAGSFAYLTFLSVPAISILLAWTSHNGESDIVWPDGMPLYVASMLEGAIAATTSGVLSLVMLVFLAPVLAGVLLYRAGWLTEPAKHLRALWVTFTVGTALGIASATPIALITLGAWEPDIWGTALAWWLTMTGGAIAGFAYIAMFALIAHGLAGFGRRGLVRAIAALGERSLSGYLAQSFLAAPLLSAWGFGVGATMGYTTALLIAVGIWVVTVIAAYALDVAGKRGPFEVLLRRLVYGRTVVATKN